MINNYALTHSSPSAAAGLPNLTIDLLTKHSEKVYNLTLNVTGVHVSLRIWYGTLRV